MELDKVKAGTDRDINIKRVLILIFEYMKYQLI